MNSVVRVGIVGYGNLGRGVETAIGLHADLELVGVFTRRSPATLTLQGSTPARHIDDLMGMSEDIDVLILCGGSKSDLPLQAPALAAKFTIVDSFDTHARIPEHFDAVDQKAKAGETTAIISSGWDPGLFSLNRLFGEAILPQGETYTFWGKGLSQGHSDALRGLDGVAGAVQYTIPSQESIDRVRAGEQPELSTREKHVRECYVVLSEGASEDAVRAEIVQMPDYFAPFDTTVHFITADELVRDHSGMPHGGFVIRSGQSSDAHKQVIEYSLALESNPEFTSSVLVAYARAAARLQEKGQFGAHTVFDVPPGLLSPKSPADLRAEIL